MKERNEEGRKENEEEWVFTFNCLLDKEEEKKEEDEGVVLSNF